MFWFRSLDIEIWDLFVIWCLGFGILRCIKPSFKYCRIYGGVTLLHHCPKLLALSCPQAAEIS